ncbi:MAG TPA: lytic transglycosylase domain-containing protein [Desulfuromonadaceae bacterium]|jgi:soluble lytic murein transglycosylase-like protein
MTIAVIDKPSLPGSLLSKDSRISAEAGQTSDASRLFAGKLDSILSNDSNAPSQLTKAQSLAEALNLQMFQTTLSLATDTPAETAFPAMINQQSPNIQALIKAYGENLPATNIQPEQNPPAPTQLQELAEPSPLSASQPSAQKEAGWLEPIIAKASRRYGVEVGLIKAVIKAESNFNPNAVSHAGARGLMQLMPATARSLGVNDSFDPEQNVMAGTRFLKDLLDRYNGNLDSTLAAYNWGPGNVDRRPEHLPRETREYLVRVKQLYSSYTG